jgi:acetyl-CoA C-acetyltransferase
LEAYVVGGVRTAIGKFEGSLASTSVVDLGAIVTREILRRYMIAPGDVGELIMGTVIQAGLGQNPARQAALKAGLPEHVPAFTVNKVCGSGLKAVAIAGQAVASGEEDMVIAGGMENMSQAPYIVSKMRGGQHLGHAQMIDSLIHDALWDSFYDCLMGMTAENVAEKYGITREEQDEFSASSQQKAERAIKEGRFKEEIVPVEVVKDRGERTVFDTDEHPRFGTTKETLAKLKPVFKAGGTITAGNSSGINDGAAALLVVSKRKMDELDPAWAFRIVTTRSAALDPAFMGLGPINACQAVVEKACCSVGDLDLIEVNEAFASQSIQVHRSMGWDMEKVNVLGGAIALGHPVGASGARILVTLMYEMVRRGATLGLASLCIGGGQGIAMIIERVK